MIFAVSQMLGDELLSMSSVLEAIQKEVNRLRQIRLLIVEDDVGTRLLLEKQLGELYTVVSAENGRFALTIARENPPHLILIDSTLPDIDSFELLQALRHDISTIHTPILFLGASEESRRQKMKALELGADDFIPKPFDIDEIRYRIRNLLPQMQHATDLITGLPTWLDIESVLQACLKTQGWHLILFTVAHLAEYQDCYGFIAGNNMRRTTADFLRKLLETQGTSQDFLGYVPDKYFFFITYTDPHIIGRQAQAEFKRAQHSFYELADIALGGIRLPDGSLAPLATLAYTVVSADLQQFDDVIAVVKTAVSHHQSP
ncbi:MAG: response regulator [Chloroflexi bacterium]|nr:MAG: response regulator [Chloroflexota bacterium]